MHRRKPAAQALHALRCRPPVCHTRFIFPAVREKVIAFDSSPDTVRALTELAHACGEEVLAQPFGRLTRMERNVLQAPLEFGGRDVGNLQGVSRDVAGIKARSWT